MKHMLIIIKQNQYIKIKRNDNNFMKKYDKKLNIIFMIFFFNYLNDKFYF